jgi:hypothetical protein
MKRTLVVSGAMGLAATLLAAFLLRGPEPEPAAVVGAKPATPTLYCEFYNFVGRSPKVGFTFALPVAVGTSAFSQINQIEGDGTRTLFASEGGPPPLWTFEVGTPPTLISPDDAIRIVLYGYEGTKSAGAWFEAGLRSIQYLNLDGKCRRSGA